MSDKKDSSSQQEQYVPRSDYSIHQSYGGWNNFMHSHGLKPWNDDDVQEGKAIVQAMKEMDKQDWEEEQAGKAGKK